MSRQKNSWILAVEDSESDMYLLHRALDADVPKPIRRARDGEQAIELLRELAQGRIEALPDVILIDLNLPRIDGHEVLAHLRAQEIFQEIPVVVVTSSEAEIDRKNALDAGADAYFVKPMDIARYGQLPDAIEEARRVRSKRSAH